MFTVQVSNVLCTLRGGKSHSFQAFRQWKGHEKKNEAGKKHRELGERAGKSASRVSKSLFYVAPWNLILKNRLPTLDHLSTQIILLIHCHKSDCVLG